LNHNCIAYRELTTRNTENKSRLVAGYWWEWPTEGRRRRGHVKHVTADGLSLSWNFSGENSSNRRPGGMATIREAGGRSS